MIKYKVYRHTAPSGQNAITEQGKRLRNPNIIEKGEGTENFGINIQKRRVKIKRHNLKLLCYNCRGLANNNR